MAAPLVGEQGTEGGRPAVPTVCSAPATFDTRTGLPGGEQAAVHGGKDTNKNNSSPIPVKKINTNKITIIMSDSGHAVERE